jgi:integrase
MSVYSVKGKGWRYDFWMKGVRYADQWFTTKKEGQAAEAKRREEILNPKPVEETPTDMTFLELINLRLDHVKAYNSARHYQEYVYMARRWFKQWKDKTCDTITRSMLERFILQRGKTSAFTANKEIRYLRSMFNFGKKRGLIKENPVDGIDFLPVSKKLKHVPTPGDIDLVIEMADCDTRDYLWVIRESLGRMSEINQLTWDDVNLDARYVVLYTRKKKGGHRTPRKIPMTARLHEVLSRRYEERDPSKPWVFWHECISSKTKGKYVGPYQDRKRFMQTLCREAGVPYFRFHALRHSRASVMETNNVPIGSIQRILGHENRSTTEIYIHSICDAERSAMDVFERARQKSHTESHT